MLSTTHHSLGGVLWDIFKREWLLAARKPGQWLQPLVFFLIVVSLFPLALNPDPRQLQLMAPGILWTAALLSATLGLDSLLRTDFDDGVLEQWASSPQPLWGMLLVKVFVHWLFGGCVLSFLAPLAAVSLAVPSQALGTVVASLLLGTASLSLLGAMAAALTLSAKRGGALMSLLLLPLAMPLLIFGARAADQAIHLEDAQGALLLLGSMTVLSLTLTPAALSAAVRIALE